MKKNRIAEIRRKENISQAQLAKLMGVATPTVTNWENGRRAPDIDALYRLSEIFNVTIDEILGNTRKKKNIVLGTPDVTWKDLFLLKAEIDDLRKIVAERLKELRAENKLTLENLAEITSNPDYHKFEKGDIGVPMTDLIKLSRFYNISIDYLLGETDNPAGKYANRQADEDVKQFLVKLENAIEEIKKATQP